MAEKDEPKTPEEEEELEPDVDVDVDDEEEEPRLKMPSPPVIALILIVIIGIFTLKHFSLDIPAKNKMMKETCEKNLKDIDIAVKLYAVDNERQFPSKLIMIVPSYIAAIPSCPGTLSDQGYITSYEVSPKFDIYTFYCKGKGHVDAGLAIDSPIMTSEKGLIKK